MERKTITLSIGVNLHRALKERAAKDGVKMYEILDQALIAWGIEPVEEKARDEKNSNSE